MNKSRTNLRDVIAQIEPVDEIERADRAAAVRWVEPDSELYRIVSPDVPPKHLVAYFPVIDPIRRMMLLVHHRKADLWGPTGGHIEDGGDPREAVKRELIEELGSRAALVSTIADIPLFITQTQTRGVGTHTDVGLWYVVAGDAHMWVDPDPREFFGHRWAALDTILETTTDELEPALPRFVRKLQGRL